LASFTGCFSRSPLLSLFVRWMLVLNPLSTAQLLCLAVEKTEEI
jgi:hypothetical protein